MCHFDPCADPTQVGVWWRDDKNWCLYGQKHQALIRNGVANQLQQIDLGTILSSVHPNGARYLVDLQNMEQVAVSSGQRRPVLIVDQISVQNSQLQAPPKSTLALPSSPSRPSSKLSLNVHYKDSQGNLQQYDPSIARALIQNLKSNSQSTILLPDGRSGYLFFNLEAMEQHVVSHFVRGQPILADKPPVQVIVEVPWDAAAMASLAAKADKCLRRKILVMVIDRFRSDKHLDNVLPSKAYPWTIVSKSTTTFSTQLYDKFVDSVEEVLQTFPADIMGDMIKGSGSEEVGNGPVQIAFKPVERLAGSSSERRSVKAAFWMSMAAPVAAAHAVVCGCTVQILAYLVILPTHGLKKVYDSCSRYVEVDRPEHQLPLAEVTVR